MRDENRHSLTRNIAINDQIDGLISHANYVLSTSSKVNGFDTYRLTDDISTFPWHGQWNQPRLPMLKSGAERYAALTRRVKDESQNNWLFIKDQLNLPGAVNTVLLLAHFDRFKIEGQKLYGHKISSVIEYYKENSTICKITHPVDIILECIPGNIKLNKDLSYKKLHTIEAYLRQLLEIENSRSFDPVKNRIRRLFLGDNKRQKYLSPFEDMTAMSDDTFINNKSATLFAVPRSWISDLSPDWLDRPEWKDANIHRAFRDFMESRARRNVGRAKHHFLGIIGQNAWLLFSGAFYLIPLKQSLLEVVSSGLIGRKLNNEQLDSLVINDWLETSSKMSKLSFKNKARSEFLIYSGNNPA